MVVTPQTSPHRNDRPDCRGHTRARPRACPSRTFIPRCLHIYCSSLGACVVPLLLWYCLMIWTSLKQTCTKRSLHRLLGLSSPVSAGKALVSGSVLFCGLEDPQQPTSHHMIFSLNASATKIEVIETFKMTEVR